MTTNKQKLVIIALGNKNSGKSNTWYEIFGRVIRTGWKKLVLSKKDLDVFIKNSSFEEMGTKVHEDVFVRNASFEEYGDNVNDVFNAENHIPNLVFCSVQYTEKGIKTISWFKDNGYYLYIQWLNPGYYDKEEYSDSLEFEKKFSEYGIFTKCSGKEKVKRINEIKQFIYKWITS